MPLMGYRAYARHRGVTLAGVQKAIASGRISTVLVGDKPRIDSDQADRDWTLRTDPAAQSLLYSAGPPAASASERAAPRTELPDPDDDGDAATEDTATVEYRTHRAERERIRKEREQLELDELRGSLIRLEDAKRLAFTSYRALRDVALAVPARVANQVAGMTDAWEIEQHLEHQLSEAFRQFNPGQFLAADDEDERDDETG